MPYFLYKVFPEKKFELIEGYDAYKEARTQAHMRRDGLTQEDVHTIKMIFAKNPDEAVRLLSEEREAPPLGEE